MKQIKLLISDLDGTLLKQDHEEYIANWASLGISKTNLKALKKLNECNIKLAIATGRMKNQCNGALEKINWLDKYFLSQNGVYIEDINNNIIKKKTFSPEHAQQLMKWFFEHGFHPFFSSYDTIYINSNPVHKQAMDAIEKHLQNDINNTKFIKLNFDELNYETMEFSNFGLDVSKISISQMEDLEHYLNEVIDFAQIFITSDNSMDIIPNEVNKATAIQDLATYLNLSLDEIAFVGDSGNDRPALQLLRNSFVIDHARSNVKVHANFIVKNVSEAIDIIIKHNNSLK